MTKKARDWPRYRLARRMREHGISYAKIGKHFGVSATRATYMVKVCESNTYWRQITRDSQWAQGLPHAVKMCLKQLGFHSREDCMYFTADVLPMSAPFVVAVPSGESADHGWQKKPGLSVLYVNTVRKWLGFGPFVRPVTAAATKRVDDAIRMLEKQGFKITK